MKTKRAFLVKPGKFEIREMDVKPGPGQILVKVAVCGLCNWEQNHWKGLLGSCPQSLGHEWAGTVVEIGEGVDDVNIGDNVTGLPGELQAFSEYMVATQGRYFLLAPDIDPKTVLGEPLKCVVTVVRAAGPEVGDVGVIVGCGPMGIWCIQALAGNSLSALIAVDLDGKKLELAKKYGATHVINPREQDAVKAISEITEGRMGDFVIEGTGVPAVMNQAVTYLRTTRGRLVLMSSHEEATREFDFRKVLERGATILGAFPAFSLNDVDDMRRAALLINKGTFQMDGIISHTFSLEEVQKAFETCEHKPAGYMKGVVLP
jgi:threonine dehydrogenase-like Zn-dependent dehydrogenase